MKAMSNFMTLECTTESREEFALNADSCNLIYYLAKGGFSIAKPILAPFGDCLGK